MILLTGFEPFGGLARNPTADAVEALRGGGVHGVVLPVDYERIGPVLAELLEEPWRAVVLTGVAATRTKIGLEKAAINYRSPTERDNAGHLPARDEVVPGGPTAYFSTLPVERWARELCALALPAEVSLSAGAYLCNAAFYLARHRLEVHRTPCGFVHVPATPDIRPDGPHLDLDVTLDALRYVLDNLRAST